MILAFGAKKRLKMEGALSVIKALLIKTDVNNIGTAEKRHSK